ncbi:MAG TPA: GspE/PulE family protein, partial [Opitutales bacterium]|nr:GspE/PulE family protein [Opitutales bacterium]
PMSVTAHSFSAFTDWISQLDEEKQASLRDTPLADRQRRLADLTGSTPPEVLKRMCELTKLAHTEELKLIPNATKVIPLRLVHEYQCLPIENDKLAPDEVALATVWPPEPHWDAWVRAVSGKRPVWVLGPADKIANLVTQSFGVGANSLDNSNLEGIAEEKEEDEEDENAAIIRFVNEVVAKAVQDRATDIHFEPGKESLVIRYRIDGNLVVVRVPDNLVRVQSAIIARIKIMARLNISERRRPQDGRIGFQSGGEDVDIRVSTMPTLYGESVSLRLLQQKAQPLSIEELGFLPEDIVKMEPALKRPHGIILITGPTGSGKSTTLTAFIRQIRNPELRIITVEDPVEYEVAGINQCQVHSEIGLTFANVLRSVLRQDPDVIMIGEIRDRETADIAIRASLTGHLVLSTVHTNDAPGAVTRLVDMGLEPFLVASSLEMVLAQRLVRRLCQVCKQPSDDSIVFVAGCLTALKIDPKQIEFAHQLSKPNGCENCRGLGYRGRVALAEVLHVDEGIHDLILKRSSALEIRHYAVAHGMRSLTDCGWELCKRGMTSLTEVMDYAEMMETEEKLPPESAPITQPVAEPADAAKKF